jgi:4-aminobutyrate aminotransferase-like enzyme
VGAILSSRAVFDRVFDSMERSVAHGSTSARTTSQRRPRLATLSEIDDAGLVERARTLGERLLELTAPLVERHEVVREVRGLGLMWAIELGPPGGARAADLGLRRASPAGPLRAAPRRAAVSATTTSSPRSPATT